MKRWVNQFFAVVALLLGSFFPAAAQTLPNVLTCATATAGAALTPWPNCTVPAYVAPTSVGLIVAVLRSGAKAAVWEPTSALQANDSVFASVPYNGSSSNWWPQSAFKWATAAPPTPVGIKAVTFIWSAVPRSTKGTVVSLASYRIYEGPSLTSISTTPYATVMAPTTTYTTPLLPVGKYYFTLSQVTTDGSESVQTPPMEVDVEPTGNDLAVVCNPQ